MRTPPPTPNTIFPCGDLRHGGKTYYEDGEAFRAIMKLMIRPGIKTFKFAQHCMDNGNAPEKYI